MVKFWSTCFWCLAILFCGIPAASGGVYPENLSTRDDRSLYDVKFYWLDLQVSDSSITLRGSVSIMADPQVQDLQEIMLDMSQGLTADSVTVNGQRVAHVHAENTLQVALPTPVSPGNPFTVTVFYHGPDANSGAYSGIYSKLNPSWNKRITWTLSEPFHAMNWFPCKQDLADKADSVYVFLSTDSHLKAGSNGLLTAQVPLPGDRIRYEWKSRYPIDYYLISFAVGDYMDYSFYVRQGENDSLLVQNYIYNHEAFLNQNKSAIDKTGDMIVLFNELFGLYPFADEKYGHCVAPLGGGMEHQTMTTLANFSFLLVAHELAHQWFGNYVTCSSWQDIWINEGFASYAEYLALQYLRSQEAADSWLNEVHDYVKSIPDGSVYVPEKDATDEDRIFDYRLSYSKGAAIIHMLRQETGNDSLFFTALKTYLHKYRNGLASGLMFRDHLEELTGKDFDDFFEQWYFGEGFPIHSVSWDHRNDTLHIQSLQTVSAATPLFTVLNEFRVRVNDRDTLLKMRQTSNFNAWDIYLPGTISSFLVDPNQWLILELDNVQFTGTHQSEPRFRIVPNPARARVNVYFTGAADPYTIYLVDPAGQIIFSRETHDQHTVLDIAGYPPGFYVILIKYENHIYQAKFVKY